MKWLLILAALPLWGLVVPGLPVTHDGTIHVARIANFYQSLAEGNIIPRWAANLNWGYGTPILMFVYPLPSYVASLLHAIGFSLVDSTKILFGSTFILSAVAMFIFARALWGTMPATAAAILYAFAPYRFVDLYVRGALGEHMAFVFPPLICWALTRRRAGMVAVSTAGLILTHNALSVMFLPIIIAYGVYVRFFGGIFWGFLLSAFFWIPAVYEQKYTLIDKVTEGTTLSRFVPWSWFVYSPWNYGGGDDITKQLGPGAWVAIVGAIFYRRFVWVILGLVAVSLFLMTEHSAFIWNSVPILEKFQFPWRFLSLTTFLTALLGGFVVSKIPKRLVIYVWFFLIFTISTTVHMWHPKGYIHKPQHVYTQVFESTTDSGEASPIWSVRFMLVPADSHLEIIAGKGTWKELSRTTTTHEYEFIAQTRVQVVENTLYFPGWHVYVNEQEVPIEFQDQLHRGLLTFWVPQGTHRVRVDFQNTKVRNIAVGISVLAWLGFSLWHIMKR